MKIDFLNSERVKVGDDEMIFFMHPNTLRDKLIETVEKIGAQKFFSSPEENIKKARENVAEYFFILGLKKISGLDWFLRQPHTSSGRVPTPKAMKLYIDQLMEEKKMSIAEEVKAKEDVWDARKDMDRLLDDATHALAEQTKSLAVAAVDSYDKVWSAGYSNVFLNPEFTEDMLVCESLFSLIDEVERLNDLFFRRISPVSPLDVLFGEDLGWPNLSPIGVVATHFSINGKNGALGIIGPTRLSYPRIIPVLKYFGNLISEVAR